jgi:hypothetical protein
MGDVLDFLIDNGLPLLGGVLGGPGGAAAGKLIAKALGAGSDDPDELMQAIQADPNAVLKLKEIESNNSVELQRLLLQGEQNRLAAETARHAETNATMRKELESEDAYVRRARPTFLYVIAFSVAVEVVIALVVSIVAPEQIAALGTLYSALAVPQGIAAGCCGIYMKKRSDDKAVQAGAAAPGGSLFDALKSKLMPSAAPG